MQNDADLTHELKILEHIETNPDTTQSDIATQLGVAVSTANWYVKRLLNKGYIKVTQPQRWRLRYLITPKGIAEKSRLTLEYMRVSLQLLPAHSRAIAGGAPAGEASRAYQVVIEGDGDAAEICRLTCVEQGVTVVTEQRAALGTPTVR